MQFQHTYKRKVASSGPCISHLNVWPKFSIFECTWALVRGIPAAVNCAAMLPYTFPLCFWARSSSKLSSHNLMRAQVSLSDQCTLGFLRLSCASHGRLLVVQICHIAAALAVRSRSWLVQRHCDSPKRAGKARVARVATSGNGGTTPMYGGRTRV